MTKTAYENPLLSRLPEYQAGRSMEELAREKGLSRVIKLSSNENPLGASPSALEAYRRAAENIHRYPDDACREISEKLAHLRGLSPDNFLFGTGSDDVMLLAVRAFGRPGSTALCPAPGFCAYPIFAAGFGLEVAFVPLPQWRMDVEVFLDVARRENAGIIFLPSPNNPTGTGLSHRDVRRLLDELPKGTTTILDLAYIEFDPSPEKPDEARLIEDYPQLIACRTFSKAYGLAGLRLGYAIARPEKIRAMKKLRTPFAASLPAQEAALAALEDQDHLRASVRLAREGVAWWTEKLRSLGLEVVPTRANFVMVLFNKDAKPIYEALLDRGIMVRYLADFGQANALRITSGTREENQEAFAALREAIKGNSVRTGLKPRA